MVCPTYDMPERFAESGIRDYGIEELTGTEQQPVLIDNRQYIKNYNINLTVAGEATDSLQALASSDQGVYTREADICERIDEGLGAMIDSLDDPCDFEQRLAQVLSLLDSLHSRIPARETGFSDLHALLRLALTCLECEDTTKDGIAVLKEASKALTHEVSSEILAELRGKFRQNGIDVLKPLKSEIDMQQVMGEIFPNETTAGHLDTNPSKSASSE